MITRNRHHGFTLTELLVSIGLALLVLYGVNRVFKSTADTVGTGQALSDTNRSIRAAEMMLSNDFVGFDNNLTSGMLPINRLPAPQNNQPLIAIRCQLMPAFMDKKDADADSSYAGQPYNADGLPATFDPTVTPSNDRLHRIDTVSFMSGGLFNRQTGQRIGNSQSLISELDIPAKAAFIHYGHARLPKFPNEAWLVQYDGTNPPPATPPATWTTQANYIGPGELLTPVDNPNNFYASQWVLARNAILLKQRDTFTHDIIDSDGRACVFLPQLRTVTTGQPFAFNSPLARNNNTADDAAYPAAPVDTAFTATPGPVIQQGLIDLAAYDGPNDGVGDSTTLDSFYTNFVTTSGVATWWTGFAPPIGYRFNSNPFVRLGVAGNMYDSERAALASNVFLQGCTQFVVEFAGDFGTQNATTGAFTNNTPDGILDFSINAAGVRGIRWYGMYRDADGDGTADVTPVGLATPNGPGVGSVPFERGALPTGLYDTTPYVCVWGPRELNPVVAATFGVNARPPQLIRITLQVRDPNGRLPDGIQREFIFRVPQN